VDPSAVYERPVRRQAVVDQRPALAEAFELGVDSRDLGVPGQRDVVRVATTDGAAGSTVRERHDSEFLVLVAVDDERTTRFLSAQDRPQLAASDRSWEGLEELRHPLLAQVMSTPAVPQAFSCGLVDRTEVQVSQGW